ncbi:unnamed protein product [Musa hybrid cultivar]
MEDGASERSKLIVNEAQNANKGGWITVPFIIGSMLGQGLALTGATGNLVVYLIKEYNFKAVDAAQIGNIVQGCTSLAPLAGAVVSDAFFGCYPVVVFSAIVTFVSLILFTLTAAFRSLQPPPCASISDACVPSAGQLAFLYTAVGLIVVGSGGTQFNMLTFGAHQLDSVGDRDVFFNWSIVVMYAVGIIGSTSIVFVEDSISWALGFGVSAAANAIAVVLVLLGSKHYRRPAACGSPFTGLARVAVAAIRKWDVVVAEDDSKYAHGTSELDESINLRPSQRFSFLNRAAWICHGDTRPDGSIAKPWSLCTVQQVEDFKSLLRVLPLWSASIFLSVSIGIQLILTVLQALTMDRSLGPRFSIPAGSMVVSSFVSTVVSLLLLDRLILPLWQKLSPRPPRPLLRIGLGHIINTAGIAASALVERKRASIVRSHQAESQHGDWVVPMTALWLVLPLAVTGVADALHFPGQVALYFQAFPRSLRSTATGMMALIIALGFYLSAAMVNMARRVTGWLQDDINISKVENVYWLVAGLTLVNFGYYVLCAKLYE